MSFFKAAIMECEKKKSIPYVSAVIILMPLYHCSKAMTCMSRFQTQKTNKEGNKQKQKQNKSKHYLNT